MKETFKQKIYRAGFGQYCKLDLFCFLDGVSTDAMVDSKISEQEKTAQNLEGGKADDLQIVKDLEDEIRKLNQKLSSTEEENKILLEEQELLKVEKIQLTQELESLKSDFSMLPSSVAEQDALLKKQEKSQSKTPLPEDVVSLQQALLGTKMMWVYFIVFDL